jgi:L-asparaginase II
VYGIPLRGLATALMKFTDPEARADATADAVRSIRDAMTGRPYLVAGRNRFCTEVMEALAPHVLVKTGAEGVFCAALLDRGLGVALKIDDGATRAAEVAVGGVLRSLGAINDSRFAALRSKLEPEVMNVAGRKVGTIRASAGLLAQPAQA